MNGLAKWLAEQPARRVVFIAGLFPLPFLGLLSAAAVVMSAQLNGIRRAGIECLAALLVVAGIGWAAGMDIPFLLASAAISWLVWLALGELLNRSGSLALAIQASVLIALFGLGLIYATIDDPVAYWAEMLEALYAELRQDNVAVDADVAAQAELMSGLVMAGSLVGTVIALLLGNGLARAAGNGSQPGQFTRLRMGTALGVLAGVLGLAELAGLNTGGALLIVGVAFMFQGMAVLGWWSQQLGWPAGWWLGLCILLVLLPGVLTILLLLFAMAGFIDNWFSLRRKSA